MEITTRKVDHSALKVNQAFIIAFLVLGFVLNSVWLVGFVAAVMLLGTAVPALSLFKGIYCLLYTSPSPRDGLLSRMPSSA